MQLYGRADARLVVFAGGAHIVDLDAAGGGRGAAVVAGDVVAGSCGGGGGSVAGSVVGWVITPMPTRAKSVTAFVRAERLMVLVDKVSPSVLMEEVCAPSLRAFAESLYVR